MVISDEAIDFKMDNNTSEQADNESIDEETQSEDIYLLNKPMSDPPENIETATGWVFPQQLIMIMNSLLILS